MQPRPDCGMQNPECSRKDTKGFPAAFRIPQPALIAVAAAVCCSLSGCAGFWDEVTSRDFKFKDMFKPAPDPLWVLRNSDDGDKRSKALLSLKEPLQTGGTKQEQEVVVKLLIQSANSDPQPLCRLAAIATLQHFKDPRAARALLDAYDRAAYFQRDRPDAMETIQEQVIQALGVNGNPIAVDDLVKILKSSPVTGNDKAVQNDLDQRIYAARALAHFPQYQAAEALVSVLRTEQNVALRNRAAGSLQKITGQDLPANAEAWDDFLRKAGKDGLAKKPSLGDKLLKLVSFNQSD
ncbi:MAG TPA: HEAT repeat domain-containing protein [Gemmataceae bacterium]|nr:HEAT repeat domain-containing protein [Gemmataceae bacterium]